METSSMNLLATDELIKHSLLGLRSNRGRGSEFEYHRISEKMSGLFSILSRK